MDTKAYLEKYYSNYDEENRLTSRHGMVEYLTTMKYIERYLKSDAKILEIGAATGRYSHTLARKGYHVDAVELTEHNIEIFKKSTLPDEEISIRQGNAMDLSWIDDGAYDIILLLGPMYHLFSEEDQLKALSEAIRVTKNGGIIFSSYCMADATIMTYGFGKGEIYDIIKALRINPETFETTSNPWDIFELYRKEDIVRLTNYFSVGRLHFIATDGYTNHMRETVEQMNDEEFELYLKYHFSVCEREDMIGYSHHTLDILKKLD